MEIQIAFQFKNCVYSTQIKKTISYEEFEENLKQFCQISKIKGIYYLDQEGDWIRITSSKELTEITTKTNDILFIKIKQPKEIKIPEKIREIPKPKKTLVVKDPKKNPLVILDPFDRKVHNINAMLLTLNIKKEKSVIESLLRQHKSPDIVLEILTDQNSNERIQPRPINWPSYMNFIQSLNHKN
ncbi:hypothetical protein M0811_02883 [Anaeramoeba ignava]|uniref:PB1 domain-containing protein n=1 Tax=Anaeramoeba ignava TaxID=1746090 RepID=A0A9Q0R5X3_ANAIG|nr:hypothetical protein M0811_02883 [Anaeramoeba ignava]